MLRSGAVWYACALAGTFSARAADLSAAELKQAHKLYVIKCSKCHEIYEPSSYTKADWDVWMEKMNRKSKVKPLQAELLNRYTERLRQQPPPKKARK